MELADSPFHRHSLRTFIVPATDLRDALEMHDSTEDSVWQTGLFYHHRSGAWKHANPLAHLRVGCTFRRQGTSNLSQR